MKGLSFPKIALSRESRVWARASLTSVLENGETDEKAFSEKSVSSAYKIDKSMEPCSTDESTAEEFFADWNSGIELSPE